MPTFGSLFSGVGGMDLGLEWAGWECRWQVEIDDWRRQVLTRHWAEVPKWKDVREFCGNRSQSMVGDGIATISATGLQGADLAVDLICGGFPCQDLSVAGRRAGLAGERSGLFFEFARIAGELKPQWLLIENVPGLLSSAQGLDFAIVLDTLDELGYGVAWRILNSQFFGVPQRRRRVFIVGHLGGPCPPEILFEPEGSGRNPQTGRETGTDIAASIKGGAGGRGFPIEFEAGLAVVGRDISHALGACSSVSGRYDPNGETYCIEENTRDELRIRQSPPSVSARRGGKQKPWLIGSPADPDGVRETTGTAGWLDACSRCPDGRRYAALGDAVTVPVAEWIGRRILKAMR